MILDRPLGDRIHRPLLAGLLWAYVTAAAVGLVVLLVAGGSWLVGLVVSRIGSGAASSPWPVAIDTAAFLAVFVVASSTWAVTYGSSERHEVIRALLGTGVGVAVLVVAVRGNAPQLTPGAFAAAWGLAIPFERWSRPASRIAFTVVAVGAGWTVWPTDPVGWWLCIASPLAAATIVGVADWAWRRRPAGRR